MMKLLKKRGFAWVCAIFMILISIGIGSSSAPGAGTKTPEPPAADGPMRDTFVQDDAGVLSSKTKTYLNDLALELREGDHPQFAVYTSDKVIKDIGDMANDMRNVWEAYSPYNDIALMIVLDIPGDNYYSATSTDAQKGPLPDGTVDALQYIYLEPDFATGDYDAGVIALCDQVYSILLSQKSYFARTGEVRQPSSSPAAPKTMILLGIGFSVLLIYLVFYAIFSLFRGLFRPRNYDYGPYPPPPRRSWWGWWGWPTYRPYHRSPPPPPPPGAGRSSNWGGGFSDWGGRSSGGGAGRSSGGSSFGGRSSGGGAGRSSGGFSGGGRSSGGGAGRSSGGGGRSSGGGAGRR